MAFRSFEDLEVWQRGCRLAVDVFKTFATCRSFTMQDQVQRSALSVPCNVAEGYERDSDKEFIRFNRLVAESKEISKMLHGLSKAVSKRLSNKPRRTRVSEP